jgi:type II secretory pathway pseudopilin PulG
MKPKGSNSIRRARAGMTLLELVIASAMMATLLTAVTLVLRSGRQSWEAHEADYTRLEGLHATLRHMVRQVRQADAVTAISAASDNSGALTLLMPDGTKMAWDHDGVTNTMKCGVTTADQLLASNITALNIVGYKPDGVTATVVPSEIQNLKISVSVQLPRDTNATRTYSSWAWIRSW